MISEIRDELLDMLITLRELEVLEDYNDVDYSEVLTDIKWSHQMLKHRLETLRLRGDKNE